MSQVAVKTEQGAANENCTFHPEISEKARTKKRNVEDLYKWKLAHDMRRQEALQKQEQEIKGMAPSKTVDPKTGQQIIDRLFSTHLEGKKAVLEEQRRVKQKKLRQQKKVLRLERKKKQKKHKPLFTYGMTKQDKHDYRKALKDSNAQPNPLSRLLLNTPPKNGLKLSISRSIFDSLDKACLPNIIYYHDDQQKLELQHRLSANPKTPSKCFFDLGAVKLDPHPLSDAKKKEPLTPQQLHGLIDRMARWQNQKQLNQNKQKEKYHAEQLDQCTFQPSLDKNLKSLLNGSPNKAQQSYQSYQDLYASKLNKNEDK